MLDLTTTEARRKVFQITLDWLKAGGHSTDDVGHTIGFDMGEVIFTKGENDGDPVDDFYDHPCDTVCCMLGHQKIVSEYGEALDDAATAVSHPHFDVLCELFFADTMSILGMRYSQVSPEMAARVLERYIETGRVDWAEELA